MSRQRVISLRKIQRKMEKKLTTFHCFIFKKFLPEGKISGDLPREGSLDTRDIEIGLRRFLGQDVSLQPFNTSDCRAFIFLL